MDFDLALGIEVLEPRRAHGLDPACAEHLRSLVEWKLSNEQLDLTGIHPEFGEVSLREMLATWVAHDLGHIAQVARVMAKQYRKAVGPWRAYLPVMDR